MRREDYERLVGKGIPRHYVGHFTEARILDIATAQPNPPDGEKPVHSHVGIILEVRGREGKAVIPLDKEECDQAILALIGCRNMIWPTP